MFDILLLTCPMFHGNPKNLFQLPLQIEPLSLRTYSSGSNSRSSFFSMYTTSSAKIILSLHILTDVRKFTFPPLMFKAHANKHLSERFLKKKIVRIKSLILLSRSANIPLIKCDCPILYLRVSMGLTDNRKTVKYFNR